MTENNVLGEHGRNPARRVLFITLAVLLFWMLAGPARLATAQALTSTPAATPTAPTAQPTPSASAPAGGQVILMAPDLTAFPTIGAYFVVRSANGAFVNLLQSNQVNVFEDNQSRPLIDMQQRQPGMRLIIAVNASPGMGVRNSQGQTRYDQVVQALQAWASLPATANNQDEFNLLANQQPAATGMANPLDWLAALSAYQPDFRSVAPSLDSLSAALMLASTPPSRIGMGKSILYITGPLPQTSQSALGDLINQASQVGVAVNVWIVGSPDDFSTDGVKTLEKLATQTGGNYVTFSGKEDLPSPETYLTALRGIYQLHYQSAVSTSGSHTLVIKITGLTNVLTSPAQFFNLTLSPPNPMFLSPPVKITRTVPAGTANPLANLTPTRQPLQILVEFPDGHSRALKYSRLYVDGKLVSENTSPPFDRFVWDISGYTQTGTHTLRVEVQDVLGLGRTSIETPVLVEVSLPPAMIETVMSHFNRWTALGAVLAAGLITAFVLLWVWRRPKKRPARQRPKKKNQPQTLPIPARSEGRHSGFQGWPERLSWPKRPPVEGSLQPQLVRLDDHHQPVTASPILLSGQEMTFGSDPTLATVVVDAPEVEALHARIKFLEDGRAMLFDQESTAGTWVNFLPVPPEGAALSQDDIIHIGKVPFRFLSGHPGHLRKPVVTSYNEKE